MRLASHGSPMGVWLAGMAIAILAVAAGRLACAEVRAGPHAKPHGAGMQLIMVDDPACRYCRAWDEDVGRGYGKSPEGRLAPLRRVGRGAAELRGLTPVIYTPTFILLRDGVEAGRISGYPGADYFYEELRAMLAQAGVRDLSRAESHAPAGMSGAAP